LWFVAAGALGVGVGEWRAERGGEFGAYQIDAEREIEVLS
jgi:hypothetical protein